jgi:hypothetical protein
VFSIGRGFIVEIKVGKKVWLKPVGNQTRYGSKEPVEKVVLKVGTKFFYVGDEGKDIKDYGIIKFHKDGLRQVTNYSPDWVIYETLQEILDEQEIFQIKKELQQVFDPWNYNMRNNLTLDQLRRIKSIIEEGTQS